MILSELWVDFSLMNEVNILVGIALNLKNLLVKSLS